MLFGNTNNEQSRYFIREMKINHVRQMEMSDFYSVLDKMNSRREMYDLYVG